MELSFSLKEAPGIFSREHNGSHRWWIAVAALTAIGAILRFVAIDSQSFYYDEAVTAKLLEASFSDLFWGVAKDYGNPPLYWICCKVWSLFFGSSEVGLRSFSAVCGVATIPLLAILGLQVLGPKTGLLAAGLLVIAPLEIELSNEARTYALLHLLVVLNVWLFARWVQERRILDWAFYVLTTALTWYSHYYAPGIQLAQGLVLTVIPRFRVLLRPWLGAMLAATVLWSPWLSAFLEQIRIPGNLQRIPGESWAIQFLATPVAFGLGRTFAWRSSPLWMHVVAFVGVLVALICPAIRGIIGLRHQSFARVLLAGWFLLPIFCPLVVAVLGKPIYSHRYGSIGLPGFLLIASFGLEQFRPSYRASLLAVLLAMTGVSLFRYATLPLRDDWRSATPIILNGLKDGEALLFDKSHEVVSFGYYASRAGFMPVEMIGLQGGRDDTNLFQGIAHRQGKSVDQNNRDYTGKIAQLPGVWLALHLPDVTADRYESNLHRQGFRLAARYAFHRITIYHYIK